MHPYAQDREARFRGGARILLGAVVVPITWFYTAMGFFVASGPLFVSDQNPIRNTALRGISVLLVATSTALIVGLVWTARWRWAMAGAWVGALVALGILLALPSRGWGGTIGLGLAAWGVGAAYAWACVQFDPPAA